MDCPNCGAHVEAVPESIGITKKPFRSEALDLFDHVGISVAITIDGIQYTAKQEFSKRVALDHCETIMKNIFREAKKRVFDEARKREQENTERVQAAAKIALDKQTKEIDKLINKG